MSEKKLSFEEAFSMLEENVASLRSGTLGLEESMAAYENCAKYHKLCSEILSEIKQKIEIYNPENGNTEDFQV